MSDNSDEHKPVRRVIWARLLLLLPFISMICVSSYDRADPSFGGVPFFYWYQLLWVLLGAVLVGIVYVLER